MENREWYTYRQAARRVKRSVTTVKRWRRNGMSMSWDLEGRRIVDHATLLAHLRGAIERDKQHRRRISDTPMNAHDLL